MRWVVGAAFGLCVAATTGCGADNSPWAAESQGTPAADPGRGVCETSGWCTKALDGAHEFSGTLRHGSSSGVPIGGIPPGGNSSGSTSSGGEHVGQTSQALTTSVHTALVRTNRDLAETSATAYQDSAGLWEMVFGTNSATSTGPDTQQFDYGCSTWGYQTWCDFTMDPGYGDLGPDNDFAYRAGSTHWLYQIKMRADQQGFFLWRTQEPCPNFLGVCSNNPTGSWCNLGLANVDFPTIHWNSVDDRIYLTFVKDGQLYVGRVNEPWCSSWAQLKDTHLGGATVGNPRAAFDSSGNLHILFVEPVAGKVLHTVYYTSSGTFSSTSDLVSDYRPPQNKCRSHPTWCPSRNTLYGFGSDCLRYGLSHGIAIDKTTSPNTLVATVGAQGSGPNCDEKQEQRFYYYDYSTAHWNLAAVTGCQTSIFADVRHASAPGVPSVTGLFQARSSYNPAGTTGLAEARWRSDDGGRTWQGMLTTATRNVYGPIHDDCYWGDYNGIAADPANNSFFYSFGNGDYGPDWRIRAMAEDE